MALSKVEDSMSDIDAGDIIMGNPWNPREKFIEGDDSFMEKGETLRTLAGLSPNFKRKATRELNKVRESADGQARSKQIEPETISGYLLFDVIVPPYNMEYLAKLYHASAPHAAAVDAKVSNIVGLGYQLIESPKIKMRLQDVDDEGRRAAMTRKIQKGKYAFQDILDGLNKEDTLLEVLKKVWTDYETTGNGYLEVGRTNTGQVGYIGHIPSPTMRVRKQRDGFVQIVSDKVTFFRNFGETTKDPLGSDPRPNEIIHIKKYTPISSFYGVPNIIAAQQAVAGNEFASRYNLDYFENKAVPRYVIVSKGANMSAAAMKKMTEFFQTDLKGQNHRTIYIPLPAEESDRKVSFEMKPIEVGTQDSSFENYHKTNVQVIFMAHRVPITKSGSADVPLAAARDFDKTFKEQVCRPEQSVFESKINRPIKELTDMFLIKLNELSLTDEDTQSQIDERNVRNGIDLINEVRARKGLPPINGGSLTPHEQEMEAQTQSEKHSEKLAKESAKVQKETAQQNAKAAATAPKASVQRKADAKATAGKTRARDSARSAAASDSKGEGRNEKGAGRRSA